MDDAMDVDTDLPPVFDIPLPAFEPTELEPYIRSRKRVVHLKRRKLPTSKFTPAHITALRVIEKGIGIEKLDFLYPHIEKVKARLQTVDQGALRRDLERFSKKDVANTTNYNLRTGVSHLGDYYVSMAQVLAPKQIPQPREPHPVRETRTPQKPDYVVMSSSSPSGGPSTDGSGSMYTPEKNDKIDREEYVDRTKAETVTQLFFNIAMGLSIDFSVLGIDRHQKRLEWTSETGVYHINALAANSQDDGHAVIRTFNHMSRIRADDRIYVALETKRDVGGWDEDDNGDIARKARTTEAQEFGELAGMLLRNSKNSSTLKGPGNMYVASNKVLLLEEVTDYRQCIFGIWKSGDGRNLVC